MDSLASDQNLITEYPASNTCHEDHDHHGCSDSHMGSNGQRLPTIFEAVRSGMLVPVQMVVELLGPEVLRTRDEKGQTPAHWACLGGHTLLLRYMMEVQCPVNEPCDNDLAQLPIHWACVNGHIALIDLLLQSGVSIDATDAKGCTPLIVACQYGRTMLVGYLIGKGARLHMVDTDGDTALHWAAFKGHNEIMRLLVYAGLNSHQRDNFGQTPLHLACINGNLISVQELIEQDQVDVTLVDKNGKTPLMLATGRRHERIVQFLQKESSGRRRFLPRLNWTLVFGPAGNSKGPFVFIILNMIFWAYPMFMLKVLPMSLYSMQYTHIAFFVMNVFFWITLYYAHTMEPGFLPKNTDDYDQAIKSVAHFDGWKQGSNPLSRLCHTCRLVRPLRAKHCRVCNRCIRMFDHHCPYIYNCVGFNNRGWFLAFLLSAFVCGSLTLLYCRFLLIENGFEILVVIGTVEASFFTFVSFMLSSCTIYHIYLGLTTNERVNYRRYDYLKDGNGRYYNPYNRGPVSNILEFIHLKRPLAEDQVHFLSDVMVV